MVMRVSLFCGADVSTVDAVVDRARMAAGDGFCAIWFAQGFNLDALSALAVAASAVPDIELGTAVVPIQGRHPLPLALQALTVADVAGPGRFTLGIGVTHQIVSEGSFGVPYRSVVDLCAEEVAALAGLIGPERTADHVGDRLTVRATVGNATPSPGLVVAALGPRMLDLAGTWADGTVTWMTGPATLGGQVVPRLRTAAERAGRPEPRVVVGLPVCITDDVEGARQRVGATMVGPSRLPSYRRMLDAEGVAEPVEIAIIGDEAEVAGRIDALGRVGATELLANVQGTPEEQSRTRSFLGMLAMG